MRAGGLGTVIAVGTAVKSLKLGDKVEGVLGMMVRTGIEYPTDSDSGWAEYAVLQEKHLQKRVPPKGANLSDFLGVLGKSVLSGKVSKLLFIDLSP